MTNEITSKLTSSLAIINARALLGERFYDNVDIYTKGPLIKKIVTTKPKALPLKSDLQKYEIVDASKLIVFPTFIDLQINGNNGKLFSDCSTKDEVRDLLEPHRRSGVTAALMTFISATFDQILRGIDIVGSIERHNPKESILGLHLEGPLISPAKSGIHNIGNLKTRIPKSILFELVNLAEKVPVVITLAPESTPMSLIDKLLDSNIKVAIGHTGATFEQTQKLIDRGCKLGTHIFNAMASISGRYPGAVGALLNDDTAYATFIADGAHLHRASIELIRRSKPHDKLILISDALGYGKGNLKPVKIGDKLLVHRNGKYISTPKRNLQDGLTKSKLGGSSISLLEAVNNCRNYYGFSDEKAIKMATLNPARYLDLEESLGHIKVGNYANLIIADSSLNIKTVILNGKLVDRETEYSV